MSGQKPKVSTTIRPLEEYKNNRSKLRFKCNECGYEWVTTPQTVLRGRGCPKCSKHMAVQSVQLENGGKNEEKHLQNLKKN